MAIESNLENLLLFLSNAYYATTAFDQATELPRAQEIQKRAQQNTLTNEDWQFIYKMYQTVTASGKNTGNDWYREISRWFGSTSHDVERRRSEGESNNVTALFSAPMDPNKLGVLEFAYGLTSLGDQTVQGISAYLRITPALLPVDPTFRTQFATDLMVAEQALGAVLALDEDDVRKHQSALDNHVLSNFFDDMLLDLSDLLLEHNALPFTLYSRALNRLYKDQPVTVYRTDLNMTTLNEKDHSNYLGTLFLNVVKQWLTETHGRIRVVQNPQNTSFQFMEDADTDVLTELAMFKRRIKSNMRQDDAVRAEQFTPRIPGKPNKHDTVSNFDPVATISRRTLTKNNLYDYAIQSMEDIQLFRMVINHNATDDVKKALRTNNLDQIKGALANNPPDIEGLKGHSNLQLRQTLRALMIKALLEFNRILAAQNSYFEKYPVTPRDGTILSEDDLSKAVQMNGDKTWVEFRRRHVGYVGSGRYAPEVENPELRGTEHRPVFLVSDPQNTPDSASGRGSVGPGDMVPPAINEILSAIPELARLRGHLTHKARSESEGGLYERFFDKLTELSLAVDEDIGAKLTELQEIARMLLATLHYVYDSAITAPRNARMPKSVSTFRVSRGNRVVNANTFLQSVVQTGNTYIGALEIDSFKAFNDSLIDSDGRSLSIMDLHKDKHYQMVADAISIAAVRLQMPPPILKPVGDHIVFSFSQFNYLDEEISAPQFVRSIQTIVDDMYSGYAPFHDRHKVDMRQVTLRPADDESRRRLTSGGLMEQIRRKHKFSAQPKLETINGSFILSIPYFDRNGDEVPWRVVADDLTQKRIDVAKKAETMETQRLLMWYPEDEDAATTQNWRFGEEQPEGYVPFMKRLTVSVAFWNHRRVRSLDDLTPSTPSQPTKNLLEAEAKVHDALAAVKESSWPNKRGYDDVRTHESQRPEVVSGHRQSLTHQTVRPQPLPDSTLPTPGSTQDLPVIRTGSDRPGGGSGRHDGLLAGFIGDTPTPSFNESLPAGIDFGLRVISPGIHLGDETKDPARVVIQTPNHSNLAYEPQPLIIRSSNALHLRDEGDERGTENHAAFGRSMRTTRLSSRSSRHTPSTRSVRSSRGFVAQARARGAHFSRQTLVFGR